jgi:hypothetical protein
MTYWDLLSMPHYLVNITISSHEDDPFDKEVLFTSTSKEEPKLAIIESLSVKFFPEIQDIDISDDLSTVLFGSHARINVNNFEEIKEVDFEKLTGKLLIFT